MQTPHKQNRLLPLDGLRGLAIALVVGFHAYSRWPEIYPYGAAYKEILPFKLGGLGVQLFFLISGFVILMTLEKCSTMRVFLVRRWLRLFPAMLICSALVFVTAPLFPERPFGAPVAKNLVSGLLFIDPFWLDRMFGGTWGEIEGALWSLDVEVIFYLIFGGAFFLAGRTVAIAAIGALGAAAIALKLVFVGMGWPFGASVLNALGFRHFGWFAAGALLYLFRQTGRPAYLGWFVAACLMETVQMDSWGYLAGAPLVAVLFAAAALSDRVGALVANRVLLFLGFVSYPLYLLHENAMVAMTVKLGPLVPSSLHIALPVLPIAAVTGVAWLVARYGEGSVRSLLKACGNVRMPLWSAPTT